MSYCSTDEERASCSVCSVKHSAKYQHIKHAVSEPTPGSLSERTQKEGRPANRASRRWQGVQFRVSGKEKQYFANSREQVISMFRSRGILV